MGMTFDRDYSKHCTGEPLAPPDGNDYRAGGPQSLSGFNGQEVELNGDHTMSEEPAHTLTISIEGRDSAATAEGAAALRDLVLQDAPGGFELQVEKDPQTQDFGATLIAVLSTGAAIAIAKGIQAYLSQNPCAIVVKKSNGGELSISGDAAKNMDPESLATSIEAL